MSRMRWPTRTPIRGAALAAVKVMSLIEKPTSWPAADKKGNAGAGPAFLHNDEAESAQRRNRHLRRSKAHVPGSRNMAGQRHGTRRDHRRQQHSSRPHGRLLRAVAAFKLPAGAGVQCRTLPKTTSDRAGPPRRTTAYFDELPELE